MNSNQALANTIVEMVDNFKFVGDSDETIKGAVTDLIDGYCKRNVLSVGELKTLSNLVTAHIKTQTMSLHESTTLQNLQVKLIKLIKAGKNETN